MHENILLSSAYFAPIQYYTKFLSFQKIFIEQYENFSKQTYRNRCDIQAANGRVSLVIPVVKGRGKKITMKNLEISYDEDWQRNHWRTIFSAYQSSPYFEFYSDDILPFFNKRWKYLLDFNLEINKTVCEMLEIENNTTLTNDFERVPENTLNFREIISPKNKKKIDKSFFAFEYTQVFSTKFAFMENLSIIDLIFNEGPNSYNILQKSITKLSP